MKTVRYRVAIFKDSFSPQYQATTYDLEQADYWETLSIFSHWHTEWVEKEV